MEEIVQLLVDGYPVFFAPKSLPYIGGYPTSPPNNTSGLLDFLCTLMHRKSAYSYPGDEDESDDEMEMPSIRNQQQGRRKAIDQLEAVFDTTFEDMVSGGSEVPGSSQAPPFMAQPNIGKYQWIADPYSQGKYEGPIPSKREARDGTFAASGQGEMAKRQRDILMASSQTKQQQSRTEAGLEPRTSPAAIAMAINDKRAPKPSDTERFDAHCLTSHPPPQMVSNYTAFPNASVNPYTGTTYTYNPCGAMVAPRPPINLGYEFSIANGEMAAAPPLQQYGPVQYGQLQQQSLGQMAQYGQLQQQQQISHGGGGAPYALPQPTSYTASNYPLAPPYSMPNPSFYQQSTNPNHSQQPGPSSESVRYVPVQVLSQPVPYSIGPQVIRPANPYYVNYTPPEAASDVGLGFPLNQPRAQQVTYSNGGGDGQHQSCNAFRASSEKFEEKDNSSQLSKVMRQEYSDAVLVAKKWKQVASLFAVGACALVGLHLFDWAASSRGGSRGSSSGRHMSSSPSTPSSMQSF
jgi:hypothetical protein